MQEFVEAVSCKLKNAFMLWILFVIKNIGHARRKELRVVVKDAANKISRRECIDFPVAENENAIHVSCVWTSLEII